MMMTWMIVARGVKAAVNPLPSPLETIKKPGYLSDQYNMAMAIVSNRMAMEDRQHLPHDLLEVGSYPGAG